MRNSSLIMIRSLPASKKTFPIAFSSFLPSKFAIGTSCLNTWRDGMRSWRIHQVMENSASACSSCLSKLHKSLYSLSLGVGKGSFNETPITFFTKALVACSLVVGFFISFSNSRTAVGRKAGLLQVMDLKLCPSCLFPSCWRLNSQEV